MSAPATNDNLAIRASAGTGKTFQLSDRIIGLLLRKEVKPEQIAALTFTRAAAAEFVVRVVSKLKHAAEADDNAALNAQAQEAIDKNERVELCNRLRLDYRQYDRGRFQELLRSTLLASNRLTMGTLDGFFAKLVNNFSLEVGISSGVATTVPDSEADKNRLEALSHVLQGADRERQAQLLASLADYNDEKNSASPIENLLEMAKNHHELYTLTPESSQWGQEDVIWGNTPPRWAGYSQKTKDGGDWAVLNDWIDNTFIETVPKALELLKGAVASGRASSGDASMVLNFLEEALNAKAGLPVTLSYDKNPYTLSARPALLPEELRRSLSKDQPRGRAAGLLGLRHAAAEHPRARQARHRVSPRLHHQALAARRVPGHRHAAVRRPEAEHRRNHLRPARGPHGLRRRGSQTIALRMAFRQPTPADRSG